MKVLEANTKELKHLLSLSFGTLNIPYNQRPYEWKEEQVLRLFNDFYSVYLNQNEQHILNFITLKIEEDDDEKKIFIYDGQQRVVTSLLIISALINKLNKLGGAAISSAEGLTQEFLYKNDLFNGDKVEYKVVFEKDTANYMLHNYIFKNCPIPDSFELNDYDKALKENFEFINSLISEKFSENPSKEEILGFVKTIVNKVLIVIIETSYDTIAKEMFETLNSTGLQLEDFYVLKNALIRNLDENKVKPIWDSIELNTDRLNKNKFLHLYINAVNGKTPAKDLYYRIKNVKKFDQSKDNGDLFLHELRVASRLYLEIEHPNQKSNGTKEELSNYVKYVNFLSTLNANQYKPVIISLGLKNFSLHNINEVLKKIISLQLRNIYVCGHNANTIEQFYPRLARDIYNGMINTTDRILQQISGETVDDRELHDNFTAKLISTRSEESIIRAILKAIYNEDHPEIQINSVSKEVNLEHILPKNPSANSQWIKDFPDQDSRISYAKKIGNLTVLFHTLNSSLKNSDFTKKKIEYEKSTIPENQLIATRTTWDSRAIEHRTKELYKKFILIWPK
ncbi:DUF262 domain-containing protein [Exiguobacterium sp. SL-9]|uniref:DUF262 domain-containing protein n=1 Tax=Exiguobacterium sp. SL-9 TaxID=2510963 RepID=UPI001039F61C|nr:DUF262 domain-containing protein [Exiguobacterium sp. SL-9]TCI21888.1 DUF262 domain-containing protein [Exiguobacterium sp. SL-9]